MGFDTVVLRSLKSAFACRPTPCISSSKNADMMLFTPNQAGMTLSAVVAYLKRGGLPGGGNKYDGIGGYDQTVLNQFAKPTRMGSFMRAAPARAGTHVVHYTGSFKPWFKVTTFIPQSNIVTLCRCIASRCLWAPCCQRGLMTKLRSAPNSHPAQSGVLERHLTL